MRHPVGVNAPSARPQYVIPVHPGISVTAGLLNASRLMRTTVLLLGLIASPLLAQTATPRFMYIYRDSLKAGVDSAYRAIEDDGAQICADLQCPNPYVGLESLSGPHEAWWLNTFASPADTARVSRIYATRRDLSAALGRVA